MLDIRGLNKQFGGLHVLHDVDLSVKKGEVVSIIGPSGTGKSTLLRCINFLEVPTSGTITIDGLTISPEHCTKQEIYQLRHKSAMIFQDHSLFENKTVLENIALPLWTAYGYTKAAAREKAESILEMIGLADKRSAYPYALSGGQQQRVGIARALVVDPKIIFADEPTGNLDSRTTMEVLRLMQRIVKERSQTLVMVTHDNNLASYADRRIRIVDGKIVGIETGGRSALEEESGENEGGDRSAGNEHAQGGSGDE